MNGKVDPRVIRTRKLLFDALKELIVSDGVEAVNIRRIVGRGDVNRSTFYLHFRDKQDIMFQMQDEILEELKQVLEKAEYDYDSAVYRLEKNYLPVEGLYEFFNLIQNDSEIFLAMLQENEFRKRIIEMIKETRVKFTDDLWDVTFMASGTIGVITHWLETGMEESAREMSLWLTRILLFPLGKFE